jgi:hypothetical protein
MRIRKETPEGDRAERLAESEIDEMADDHKRHAEAAPAVDHTVARRPFDLHR